MIAPSYPWAIQAAPFIARAALAIHETPETVTSPGREQHLTHARWAVMMALHDAGWSTPRIGRALDNRDHTTVLYGLKKARSLRATCADFAELCRIVTLPFEAQLELDGVA
jgi:chromosomal replication initiation ATPase DnaA